MISTCTTNDYDACIVSSCFKAFVGFLRWSVVSVGVIKFYFHVFIVKCLLVSLGRYGDTLRYVSLQVSLTLDSQDVELSYGQDVRNSWDSYVEQLKANAPTPLASIFHATPEDNAWAWISAQAVRSH
jgi:hypothetical protein